MGIRKFTGLVGSWIFSNSAGESGDIPGDDTPEEGTINDDDQTILVPALVRQQPSFDTELEHDDDQPGNKKRKATHDAIVIYDHEQGSASASSSQRILDWLLSNDPGVCRINEVLRRKLRSLFARAFDVSTELKHDEIQPKKKRRMEVHQWLTDVYQIRDEVQNLATDGKSIEHFTSQVDELLQRGNFPHGYVLPDDSPIELLLLSKNPAGKMFAKNTAIILEWLKNNERCIIGVYGMGGVGKTTMLRWLYDEVLKNESNFGRPYWVTVSQNCDEHKLQHEIAKVLGVDFSGENDDRKRAAILHKRLSTMGPTVLFLDDMWKWNPFLGMDIDFPIEGSSCKIILSSRSRKVCQEMGCKGFVIETKPLPEGEAWNLFVDKLGHYDKLTEEAKGIARSIAEKCGGLPLAIATMARSMTEVVDVREWNDVLNELRQPSREQSYMEYVFSVLKYSYNRLNDQRLQNCFLSCILYPEDYKIKREDLIDEWIMEGLLDDVGDRSKQLNKGHAILNKLINSCLLEACTYYGVLECVTMHDLMRDLAIMITKKYPCFWLKSEQDLDRVPEEKLWCKELVKVSLTGNDIKVIPNGMAPPTPELTLLKLNKNPLKSIPESFFMHMQALTVLDLSDTDIVRLPESVSDLANLRALLLGSCSYSSKLTYVPSLAKLSKLRVLDLDCAEMLEKAPDGIEKLKCLEKVTYLPWDVSDSTGFNKLIQSLPSSLSCYRFWLHDPKYDKYVATSDYEHIWECENILLVAGANIEDDETTYMLPATIKILEIYESDFNRRNLGDVFPTLGLATDLKRMYINSCTGLKYMSSLSSSSSSSGPQEGSFIEDMHLESLPDLRGLIEFEGCTFTHLCDLEIENCPKIKIIFPFSEKKLSLPNLKYLGVSCCDELEVIFESNKNNHHNSALPNLVSVDLKSLPKLQRLYMNPHLCTSLEKLSVESCEELEEIFESGSSSTSSSTSQGGTETLVIDPMSSCIPQPNPVSALPRLRNISLANLPKLGSIYKNLHLCTSLEELRVRNCEELEEIFESGGSYSPSPSSQGEAETLVADPMNACNSPANPISALSKLRILSLENLPKLKIYKDLHLCSSLEELNVVNCPKIEQIFEAPELILALPNLRELKLHELTNLSSIHRGLHLCSSLEMLKVVDCPKIEQIFEAPELILALPNLRELILHKLTNLSSIHRGLHLCSSLQVLEVMDCPKIEQIFEAPELILALPNLRVLKLHRLTNLSSIHRGLLLCTSLNKFSVEGCYKVKKVPLSDHLICDDSPSSLLSLPSKSDNPELWELLQSDYSEDARLLSDFIQYHVRLQEHNQNQLKLKRKRSDL